MSWVWLREPLKWLAERGSLRDRGEQGEVFNKEGTVSGSAPLLRAEVLAAAWIPPQ